MFIDDILLYRTVFYRILYGVVSCKLYCSDSELGDSMGSGGADIREELKKAAARASLNLNKQFVDDVSSESSSSHHVKHEK